MIKRENNLILLSDSYKPSHYLQYPQDTDTIYSYFESRGGIFDKTIFFGLQYFLKEYLEGNVVRPFDIKHADKMLKKHFMGNGSIFNREGWEYIYNEYAGKLPVSIKAVPEGTEVETSNVLMTIENTDPNCYWLTNYLETLLVEVWYPTTVATLSKNIKNDISYYLKETGDISGIDFKLHDFGFRGVSSPESAGLGGMAHLVNFKGTDTMLALDFVNRYYGINDEPIAGYSIPASEHSTITAWGEENEYKAMENMLDKYPKGLVACVSDSYDIYNACENIWGTRLRDKVMNRDGTLVIRPDSGDPVTVILKVLDILGNKFGYEKNEKGYKVLDPHVRIIQGDGVDRNGIIEILESMKTHKWSADNIAFGMGGGLLQKLNRDTNSFAFKCSARRKTNGEWMDVYKDPVNSNGKKSKRGRLRLINGEYGYYTDKIGNFPNENDSLVEVFRNGKITREYTFDEVRKNSNKQWSDRGVY